MTTKVVQVFESHSKLDEHTCDLFDKAVARVGIKAFRSEYEDVKAPAWETIKDEMKRSTALFLLVGPELVKAQAQENGDWKFTQNWIAYEVGLACALGIDVWVQCDGTTINFPVPYLNNYTISKIDTSAKGFERAILQNYLDGKNYPFGFNDRYKISCPRKECGAKFNFYTILETGYEVICPTCLQPIVFRDGWLL